MCKHCDRVAEVKASEPRTLREWGERWGVYVQSEFFKDHELPWVAVPRGRVPGFAHDTPALDRLRAFLALHPNSCEQYTLEQIGAVIGVSRERVRQLMPQYGQTAISARQAIIDRKLTTFLSEHPEAHLPATLGGMTIPAIATAIGLKLSGVERAWQRLGLPSRTLIEDSYTPRERNERYWAFPLGEETCVSCGDAYTWTRRHEHGYRCGLKKFNVCSIQCGNRMRGQPPSWPMDGRPRHLWPRERKQQ